MVLIRTRRHVCFATVTEGDLAKSSRERCESTLFERLAAARIEASMVAVNDGGCAFVVDEHDLEGLRQAVRSLNVALRVRTRCVRIALSQRRAKRSLPSIGSLMASLAEAGICVIHLAADAQTLTVLVEERDASGTQAALSRCAAPIPQTAA
jgi:aspartokinase